MTLFTAISKQLPLIYWLIFYGNMYQQCQVVAYKEIICSIMID